jgi:nucleoside-diphosphate-sugar epimerase
MDVAIAGAHGQIGRRLTRLLVGRGDDVRGLIRNPDHSADVEADGGRPVVCDLERAMVDEVAAAIAGADAAVFAAGAGPGSGAERKFTMDRDGAILLLDAARAANVARYVIVSSIGAESPPSDDDVFSIYLRAKAEADQAVAASDREWTILRPGHLTNDAGTGQVALTADSHRGQVPRDDVAAVLDALLHEPRSAGLTLYVISGDTPLDAAVGALV